MAKKVQINETPTDIINAALLVALQEKAAKEEDFSSLGHRWPIGYQNPSLHGYQVRMSRVGHDLMLQFLDYTGNYVPLYFNVQQYTWSRETHYRLDVILVNDEDAWATRTMQDMQAYEQRWNKDYTKNEYKLGTRFDRALEYAIAQAWEIIQTHARYRARALQGLV